MGCERPENQCAVAPKYMSPTIAEFQWYYVDRSAEAGLALMTSVCAMSDAGCVLSVGGGSLIGARCHTRWGSVWNQFEQHGINVPAAL